LELVFDTYSTISDTYNATWSIRGHTDTSPNPRQAASLSCFNNGKMILYGGTIGSAVQFDLWLYDYYMNTWIQTAPSGSFPIARWFHKAPVRNGNEAFFVTGYNDTWETEDIWSLSLTTSSDILSEITATSSSSITSSVTSLSLRKLSVPGVSYSPRSGSIAVVVGQSVFVFGASSCHSPL
jgi:hypothetical protein